MTITGIICSAREIIIKVNELKKIFPTGLIISPSHEAILADIPPANIEALFKEISETTMSTRRQNK